MCVLEELFLILKDDLNVRTLAFHECAALFLQAGGVNEEIEEQSRSQMSHLVTVKSSGSSETSSKIFPVLSQVFS